MTAFLKCFWRHGFSRQLRLLVLKALGGISIERHRAIVYSLQDEIEALRVAFPAPYEREW